jgi:3-oxoacyl-[acyl-carrier-protein] synthase I
MLQKRSGIREINDPSKSQVAFWASCLDDSLINRQFEKISKGEEVTKLEKLIISSVYDALQKCDVDITSSKTLIVLSSAKGNIDLIEGEGSEERKGRILLSETARVVQQFFKNPNRPLVISNGCISGVLALVTASRLIEAGQYENVVVVGADVISEFTVSGFQSFKALAEAPCKPFDKTRTGLNLGEGAATIVLTSRIEKAGKSKIEIIGGGISNDANHISGPSRTGEGLYIAIKNAMKEAEKNGLPEIGFLSAHGTATVYNDEMESLAFKSADLENVPVNSLKGYFGHTLGAAGVIESVITIQSLVQNHLFESIGFEEHGVTGNLNVIKKSDKKELKACLKTASGFGGCNAAIIYKKNG